VAEIAALLDVPENTVKSYLHRARRLLHATLDERGFHE
jgi:DNA-directed RNA polymerase specialized sigma24 family protein